MQAVSFKRYCFPPEAIRQAVWLYFRFTLSLCDVEEMLAEREIETNYETIRCWAFTRVSQATDAPIQSWRSLGVSTGNTYRQRHKHWRR